MAVFVHRETQFNKLLDNLRRAGGRGTLAAARAEEIMERLAAGTDLSPSQVRKLTRHGEGRLEGCRKFDLGAGYRLIYLRKGEHIVFSYIGTHDDCDLWIKNNRGLEPEMDAETDPFPAEKENEGSVEDKRRDIDLEPDYDDLLMAKIDDRLLRRIFRGLCGEGGGS